MTDPEKLAAFVTRATYDDLSETAWMQLTIRVLDALGCAIGALDSLVAAQLRAHTEEFGGQGRCTLIGGGQTAPDRAAFHNSSLVRYLDFNDSYLAKGETCHPSDNLASVLAACEYANRSGQDFLTAMAIAYQAQCRLSDVAPVRAKGFDHTTQGSYAVAAGVAKGLGLDEQRTANALAICGTAFNALRVTRTGALSNWKGLAYANTALGCTHAAFVAMRGITGPLEIFEGIKGFMDTIAGRFDIDWSREDLERVTQTILKKYNAEIHSQSAIEAVLELKRLHGLTGREVEEVHIKIFDVAFHIIGGGEEGDKRTVTSKEEADHSLPYLVSVALLDGEVMPPQFSPDRLGSADVQALLQKVHIRPVEELSGCVAASRSGRLVG
jgi:2-methylcitrate dehydratase